MKNTVTYFVNAILINGTFDKTDIYLWKQKDVKDKPRLQFQ